jgi:hypothetical protein
MLVNVKSSGELVKKTVFQGNTYVHRAHTSGKLKTDYK